MEEQKKPSKRGGARPGAGRPAEHGKTVVMRVPEAYKAAIQALIKHLDDTKHINHHYAPVESEPLFMRSLLQKRQHLTFKTGPVVAKEDQQDLNL
ncbi:hypothetical protein D3C81_1337900 [compost metagenome]